MIQWQAAPNLPSGMLHPQVAVTPTTVFVGGGVSKKGMLDIYAFDLRTQTWSTLPSNSVMVFGMCMFRETLITVGGGTAQGLTNKAFSLDPNSKILKWEEFEPMGHARMALTAVSSRNFVVALGGAVWVVGKKDPTPVKTTEVYHSSTKQWQRVSDIPYPCASMSSTVHNDVCYLMGDIEADQRRKVLCVDLLQFALPCTPLEGSCSTLPELILSRGSSSSDSCLSPSLSLSPYPSPSHVTQPESMAAIYEQATTSSDDAFAKPSMEREGVANSSPPSFDGFVQVHATSPAALQQLPMTPPPKRHAHSTADGDPKPVSDNAASATAPPPISQSTADANLAATSTNNNAPSVHLSHSPVNAISTNDSISTSSFPPPSSPLNSASSHLGSPSSAFYQPFLGHLHPIAEQNCVSSKSVPDLDKLPRLKTPYYFYQRAPENSKWFTLSPPLTENGCILGINDNVITLGGFLNGELSRATLLYSKKSNRWLKVRGADIPKAVEGCTCAMLKTGEIILIGGEDAYGEYSSNVFVGSRPA